MNDEQKNPMWVKVLELYGLARIALVLACLFCVETWHRVA